MTTARLLKLAAARAVNTWCGNTPKIRDTHFSRAHEVRFLCAEVRRILEGTILRELQSTHQRAYRRGYQAGRAAK